MKEENKSLRAPAYPLITIDPYTSAWSFSDKLNNGVVRHWTGKEYPLVGALRVDGRCYRFLGLETMEKNFFNFAADQKSVEVLPTRTIYKFICGPVYLTVTFLAPLFCDDLERLSTPVNLILYEVETRDNKAHEMQIYLDASPLWAMDKPWQPMAGKSGKNNAIVYSCVGTKEQPVLQKKGDDRRIDWGYLYIAASETSSISGIAKAIDARSSFADNGSVKDVVSDASDNMSSDDVLVLSSKLATAEKTSGCLLVAYDDIYSIQYYEDNRLAYWHKSGKDILTVIAETDAAKDMLLKKSMDFDKQLMDDAERVGGHKYAELCALVYRQCIAAHKLVTDKDGNLLFFSKENFSNGSIGTVDLTYPSAPLFLIYNPELLKGMMTPIFYYSESGKWTKPFAAHDSGTYPMANGQTYGGDMPVEESGNMLILAAAIARVEKKADFAKKHWKVLTIWTDYLVANGLNPENQLCTDDFAGHFAHNTNLSIKAILGIASYGILAEMLGKKKISKKYMAIAREMAAKWVPMADDGDHYRLTFDKQGTWSQKYNMIWDRFFGLNLFPKEVAEKEMKWYLSHQNRYGLPLDNRRTYSKSDWIMWTACLTNSREDFEALVNPVWDYVNEGRMRMPLSDWHETTDATTVGFRARSVVGAYFMSMLLNKYNQLS